MSSSDMDDILSRPFPTGSGGSFSDLFRAARGELDSQEDQEDELTRTGRVLLVAGIREELDGLFRLHSFDFDKSVRAYRSRAYDRLYATTSGPGLKNRKVLRRTLLAINPDIIVNAGLVGVLDERDGLKTGERLRLGSVVNSRSGIIYPGGPGRDVLVSVPHPLFSPLEKMNAHLDFQARVCDMEAAGLIELTASLELLAYKTVLIFIKIAGDRPEQYDLFRYEHLLRGWNRWTLRQKALAVLRFPGGYRRLRKLQAEKKSALHQLTQAVNDSLKQILESGGRTDNLDSLFIPH